MPHKFAEIAFTHTVRGLQEQAGSRGSYARMDGGADYNQRLTERERDFIAARDSFYMATVSETGWPYVQHRGGPAGFMKILDERTLGFADYSGNRQYLSAGNLVTDNRVALFFMDYPNQRRLKLLGRVRQVPLSDRETLAQLEDPEHRVAVERGFVITVEAYDWNCPKFITPRFSQAEVQALVAPLVEENRQLRAGLGGVATAAPVANDDKQVLGSGPLALVISGVRQLTPRVRAFELRHPQGEDLPLVTPGSHLRVPVLLDSGERVERNYSIASNPARRDAWEIAVLREEAGAGGSRAVHRNYELGTTLNVDPPENHFPLHDDDRPAVLIAGGIGITPIKAMALALLARGTDFHLHYAGRATDEMAYRDRLERQLDGRISIHASDAGQRIDLSALLADAAENAVVYVCGPDRLMAGVLDAADAVGINRENIRMEAFQ